MKICVIGTGYVGLVAGTCFADMGNEVVCVDNNEDKIKQLSEARIPIYEPGLEDLIKSNTKEGRLRFSLDLVSAVKESEVCFIAVGTPQREDGSCNLDYVFDVVKSIAKSMNGYKLIVNKSTVPVGTAEQLIEVIKQNSIHPFDVVSNPEFLKQGAAVEDFLYPDRIIIGCETEKAKKIMQEIYSPFMKKNNRIIFMDTKSAEMVKYASNAFLATKISFMNEIANLCEKTGADIEFVRSGVTTDSRIGNSFMFPGLGFGGSCFPKDVKALIKLAEECGSDSSILESVDFVNKNQRMVFVNKILDYFKGDIKNKTFAVWGLAFKPKTNDMREAPSITIIEELLKHGAKIRAYDPKAINNAKQIFFGKIDYAKSSYEALEGVDALLLLTEWNEFRHPDFDKMKKIIDKRLIIFDGRNQYDRAKMKEIDVEYISIGRKSNAI